MNWNIPISIVTALLISLIVFQLIFLVVEIDFDVIYSTLQWQIVIAVFAIPIYFILRKLAFKDIKKVTKESYYKKIK